MSTLTAIAISAVRGSVYRSFVATQGVAVDHGRGSAGVPLKVRELIKLIEDDGWRLLRVRGSHRQYVHPTKAGVVTVPGKMGKDLPVGTERSILGQAGIDRRPR